jgi:ParB-like chromosome segregation protein Spo0J
MSKTDADADVGMPSPQDTRQHLFPTAAPQIRQVALAAIDPTPQPWHVRRSISPHDIERLRDAIRATGRIEPLILVESEDAQLHIVAGVLRYHAAVTRREQGGEGYVPAIVLPRSRAEDLLRFTILEGEARVGWSALELGWALMRLRTLLAGQRAASVTQRECMEFLQVPPGRWKSRVSEALKIASTIPENLADELAQRYRCSRSAIVGQPRAVFRQVAATPTDAQPAVLAVLAESVTAGHDVARAVRQARRAFGDPEVLQQAHEALRTTGSVSSIIPEVCQTVGRAEEASGRSQTALRLFHDMHRRILAWITQVWVFLQIKVTAIIPFTNGR